MCCGLWVTIQISKKKKRQIRSMSMVISIEGYYETM